jgi:hypothetical protein
MFVDKPKKVVHTHNRCKRISNFQFNKKRHDFSTKRFGKKASQLQTSEAATKRLKFSSLQGIVSFRQSNNLFKMNKAAKKEPEYSPMTKPHRHQNIRSIYRTTHILMRDNAVKIIIAVTVAIVITCSASSAPSA